MGALTAIFEHKRAHVYSALVVFALDVILTTFIIRRVRYTEIDWVAYMQEVESVVAGERDYSKIKGQTGPLVYPAGFVWIFIFLRWITDEGRNVARAQLIFAAIYLTTQAIVLRIYVKARLVPPWALVLLILSKRIHSLYVLRLFNDCVAMLFLYTAILLFTGRRWKTGCAIFSLAVSVKMNILLFAPALLYLLLCAKGVQGALLHILLCAIVQLALALPFLVSHPASYIAGSFDLSRVFLRQWSVNLNFLPNEVFVSKWLAVGLLVCHVGGLGLVYSRLGLHRLARRAVTWGHGATPGSIGPAFITNVMLCGNFIGIVFCRSIHFQFYTWYFHAVPALLWAAARPPGGAAVRVLLWGLVEAAYNLTDPAGCDASPPGPLCGTPRPAASAAWLAAHGAVFLLLLASPPWCNDLHAAPAVSDSDSRDSDSAGASESGADLAPDRNLKGTKAQ